MFTADQSRRILQAAAGYGLALRLHADELAPSGGAELAAELGALSADHLHVAVDEGSTRWAAAAASDYADRRDAAARHDVVPHGRRRRARPAGSSTPASPSPSAPTSTRAPRPTPNLPLVMTVACLEMRLTPAEALAAVTINAALRGRASPTGRVARARQAGDLVVWRARSVGEIPYWVGRRPRRRSSSAAGSCYRRAD